MKRLCVLLVSSVAISAGVFCFAAAEDEKPLSIKAVMKTCMKGGLCKKVAGGQATDEEKKTLLDNFTALTKNKPPKGDEESWKKLTGELVKAAQAAVEGDAGAGDALKKAANCGACHKLHKPS